MDIAKWKDIERKIKRNHGGIVHNTKRSGKNSKQVTRVGEWNKGIV